MAWLPVPGAPSRLPEPLAPRASSSQTAPLFVSLTSGTSRRPSAPGGSGAGAAAKVGHARPGSSPGIFPINRQPVPPRNPRSRSASPTTAAGDPGHLGPPGLRELPLETQRSLTLSPLPVLGFSHLILPLICPIPQMCQKLHSANSEWVVVGGGPGGNQTSRGTGRPRLGTPGFPGATGHVNPSWLLPAHVWFKNPIK